MSATADSEGAITVAKIGRDLDWKALFAFEDVELMMA
jgi:hypothetical protein